MSDCLPIALRAARWLGRATIAVLYAAPLAWVACLMAFAIAVTLKVGHFPSYSNPDPKHVAGLSVLYDATVVLFFLTLLSPLVLGAVAARTWRRAGLQGSVRTSGIYLAGLVMAGAVMFGDAFGLMTWLLD